MNFLEEKSCFTSLNYSSLIRVRISVLMKFINARVGDIFTLNYWNLSASHPG